LTQQKKEKHSAETPALAALRRAAKEALELAKRTGPPCYVLKNGKIVDIARSKTSRARKPGKSS
jgi:hypothetical protein